ncbi:hypothetical protein MMC11_003333 [Xylographa trunciseda]|nr:hypothetical protein [Xylographa trunciseda]
MSDSEIEAGPESTDINSLRPETQDHLRAGLKGLKSANANAKTYKLKGTEHPSSTVPAQGEVISVQIQDGKGSYLGTVHVDAEGTVIANTTWNNNVEKASAETKAPEEEQPAEAPAGGEDPPASADTPAPADPPPPADPPAPAPESAPAPEAGGDAGGGDGGGGDAGGGDDGGGGDD